MNICVPDFGWIYVFTFFGRIIGSCGNSGLTFWRTAVIFFKVVAPFRMPTSNAWRLLILHILTNTCYHLFYFIHPICVKRYFLVVWISISLMTNDVEYLFMCLFAIFMYSLEKFLFKFIAHFKSWVNFLFIIVLRVIYIIWIPVPYQILWFTNIFSLSVDF